MESWITEGRFSDRPDREHGNPLKAVRTRADVGKKLGRGDRRRIPANFPHLEGNRKYDVTTKTISMEFYVTA